MNNYKKTAFGDIIGQLHTQECKATKKADSETSAEWKKVKRKPDNINELILKTKADLKEGPNNI